MSSGGLPRAHLLSMSAVQSAFALSRPRRIVGRGGGSPISEQPVPECAATSTIDGPTEGISDEGCLEICQAGRWPCDHALLQRHNLDKAIGGEACGRTTPIPSGDEAGVAASAHGVCVEIANDEGGCLRIGRRTMILLSTKNVLGI